MKTNNYSPLLLWQSSFFLSIYTYLSRELLIDMMAIEYDEADDAAYAAHVAVIILHFCKGRITCNVMATTGTETNCIH